MKRNGINLGRGILLEQDEEILQIVRKHRSALTIFHKWAFDLD